MIVRLALAVGWIQLDDLDHRDEQVARHPDDLNWGQPIEAGGRERVEVELGCDRNERTMCGVMIS